MPTQRPGSLLLDPRHPLGGQDRKCNGKLVSVPDCPTPSPGPVTFMFQGLDGEGMEAVGAQEALCTWVVPSRRWVWCVASHLWNPTSLQPSQLPPHPASLVDSAWKRRAPSSCSHLPWLTHKAGRSLSGRQEWHSVWVAVAEAPLSVTS